MTDLKNVVIIHDDLDSNFGMVKLKKEGSASFKP